MEFTYSIKLKDVYKNYKYSHGYNGVGLLTGCVWIRSNSVTAGPLLLNILFMRIMIINTQLLYGSLRIFSVLSL